MEAKIGLSMLLFTRPDYESVTKYLSAWSKVLIEEARAKAMGEGYLRSLESSLSDPNVQMAAAFLWRDIAHLVVHGEGDKKAI